jgi:hypothetical protein
MMARLLGAVAATLAAAALLSGCQKGETRAPTEEERIQIQAARQAGITSCESMLGRKLEASEVECIHVEFKNGMVTGSVGPPLSDTLKRVSRQAQQLPGRKADK